MYRRETPQVEEEQVGRSPHRFIRDEDKDDEHVADDTDREHEAETKIEKSRNQKIRKEKDEKIQKYKDEISSTKMRNEDALSYLLQ